MKKIDFGQTISILSNVGVIAGIVFLGIELRQNNDFLAAQASFSPTWRRAWESTLGNQDTEFARFVNENVFAE